MATDFKRFMAVALLVAAASCESPTTTQAPSSARSLSAVPRFDIGHAAGLSSGSLYHGTFTLTAQGGVVQVGPFMTITFPANAVCDPNTSTYGPGHWNDACQTLGANQTVTETVTIGVNNGVLQSDFSTPVRFAPGAVVTLSTYLYAPYVLTYGRYLTSQGLGLRLGIDYAPSFGAASVDDALTDPDVVTHIDWSTGRVWRRLKHFSGYNVTSGEPCDPSPDDPDCIDTGNGGQS